MNAARLGYNRLIYPLINQELTSRFMTDVFQMRSYKVLILTGQCTVSYSREIVWLRVSVSHILPADIFRWKK